MTVGNKNMLVIGPLSEGHCVYLISNLVTGERYIGYSSNIRKRISQHESVARKGKVVHREVTKAMTEYGIELFSIKVLKYLENQDSAHLEEQRLIAALQPEYNTDRGGKGRQVRCLDDGKIFKSASECSRHYRIAKSALIEHCLGKHGRQHVAHMRFEYVGDSAQQKIAASMKVKKLTPKEAIAIKRLKGIHSIPRLMEMFSVGRDAVSDIHRGITWRELN